MYPDFVHDLLRDKESRFSDCVEHFKTDIATLRTGRATPALVEHVLVDYYGTKTPLKQIASITVPEARSLMIQAWDRGALVYIESALREADLGVNPVNDGAVIRINLPPLTEERRKDLVKALGHKAEEARISVRNIREEILRDITTAEKDGKIGEDDRFRGKEAVQKLVDKHNALIEELKEKKEKEIMTV